MIKHEHNPDQLRDKYTRRSKIAAWAAAILPVGTVVATEASFAHTANAADDKAAKHEAMSDQEYIAVLSKKLEKLKLDVIRANKVALIGRGTPNLRFNDTKKHTDVYMDYMPNPKNPKHYDIVGVNTGRNEKLPLFSEVNINHDPKSQSSLPDSPDSVLYSVLDNSSQGEKPSNIYLTVLNNKGLKATYAVGPEDVSHAGDIEYSKNPTVVMAQFDHYFQMAERIINHK